VSLRAKRSNLFIESPLIPLYKRGELIISLYQRETERDFNRGEEKEKRGFRPSPQATPLRGVGGMVNTMCDKEIH